MSASVSASARYLTMFPLADDSTNAANTATLLATAPSDDEAMSSAPPGVTRATTKPNQANGAVKRKSVDVSKAADGYNTENEAKT